MRDKDLVMRLAELLADELGWAWRPEGPSYGPAETAIFYGPIQPSPDRAVGITPYLPEDDLRTGLAQRRVQLLFRGAPGDPAGADDLADDAFGALQGMARRSGLSLVSRAVVARLGADENSRQERADSYQIILDNVEATA